MHAQAWARLGREIRLRLANFQFLLKLTQLFYKPLRSSMNLAPVLHLATRICTTRLTVYKVLECNVRNVDTESATGAPSWSISSGEWQMRFAKRLLEPTLHPRTILCGSTHRMSQASGKSCTRVWLKLVKSIIGYGPVTVSTLKTNQSYVWRCNIFDRFAAPF